MKRFSHHLAAHKRANATLIILDNKNIDHGGHSEPIHGLRIFSFLGHDSIGGFQPQEVRMPLPTVPSDPAIGGVFSARTF